MIEGWQGGRPPHDIPSDASIVEGYPEGSFEAHMKKAHDVGMGEWEEMEEEEGGIGSVRASHDDPAAHDADWVHSYYHVHASNIGTGDLSKRVNAVFKDRRDASE